MNEFDLDFKAFLWRHRPTFHCVTLLQCDRPTRNGYIYPRALMERVVARQALKHPSIGGLEHPLITGTGHVLGWAAFFVDNMRLVAGEVKGDVQFLSTPSGLKLKTAVESGLRVTYSIEGTGTVDDYGVVQNDFRLESVAIHLPDR